MIQCFNVISMYAWTKMIKQHNFRFCLQNSSVLSNCNEPQPQTIEGTIKEYQKLNTRLRLLQEKRNDIFPEIHVNDLWYGKAWRKVIMTMLQENGSCEQKK